jgi:hypothetical protein
MDIFRFRINKIYLLSQIVPWEYLPGREEYFDAFHQEFPREWRWVKERARKVVHDEDKGIFIVDTPDDIPRCPAEVKRFFVSVLRTKEFKMIVKETQESLFKVKKEWEKNQRRALVEFCDIVRLPLDPSCATVLITHPALPNGRNYPSQNAIGWTYRKDWKNYNTVYLMHEFLHLQTDGRFKRGDVMHAIVELATDNELKIRLGGTGNYFENGHSGLKKLEKKIYPFWKEYLQENKENLIQFNRRMEKFA